MRYKTSALIEVITVLRVFIFHLLDWSLFICFSPSLSYERNGLYMLDYYLPGYTPIINADVWVTVMVPNGPHVPLEVWDDGVGPDVRFGDGVYSGFFTQFKGIGRYSVKVRNIPH